MPGSRNTDGRIMSCDYRSTIHDTFVGISGYQTEGEWPGVDVKISLIDWRKKQGVNIATTLEFPDVRVEEMR